MSHPVRGAWIEISLSMSTASDSTSHPVRGAWIEITLTKAVTVPIVVASRKGCVD